MKLSSSLCVFFPSWCSFIISCQYRVYRKQGRIERSGWMKERQIPRRDLWESPRSLSPRWWLGQQESQEHRLMRARILLEERERAVLFRWASECCIYIELYILYIQKRIGVSAEKYILSAAAPSIVADEKIYSYTCGYLCRDFYRAIWFTFNRCYRVWERDC